MSRSIAGGHSFLASTSISLASAFASASSRPTRRSASASGPRATSSPCRAAECAASARSAAASAAVTAFCAASAAPASAATSGAPFSGLSRLASSASTSPICPSSRTSRAEWSAIACSSWLRRATQVGERAGQFAERLLDLGERRLGRRHARRDLGFAFRHAGRVLRQAGFFRGKPLQRRFGVGAQPLLALDILHELHQAAVELGDALIDARFLAVERLARHHEALQRGAGLGLVVAQRRQVGGRVGLMPRGLGLRAGRLGDAAHALVLRAAGFRHFGIGRDPAQMEQRRLGLAHVRRDLAVAHRLACLPLQRVDLLRQLPDHVFEPRQVGLGRLQPQLRLVAPRMQPGDAGGFLQHAAALFGLGLDDLADAALMHQRGRARTGRCVGEQDLHVARAHLAAVEPVHRALLALDAARDLDGLAVVELRRRRAIGVVEEQHHLGGVARRPGVGAGKDHVVHAGGAQRLVRGLAHHPAQRLDQVGLAAAVRADHAGEAVLDMEVGRLDERLEPEQTQLVEFHSLFRTLNGAFCPNTNAAPASPKNESGGVPSWAGE